MRFCWIFRTSLPRPSNGSEGRVRHEGPGGGVACGLGRARSGPGDGCGVRSGRDLVHPRRSGRDALRVLCALDGIPPRRADEVIDLVDLTAAGARNVGGYSMGMRQRLAVGRAFLHDPGILLRSNKGIGSFGGLGGGLLAGLVWMRRRRLDFQTRWLLLDNITYALPVALAFGRLGCALAHDHRGLASAGWIAVRFPEGPRYDLGLIEFLFLIPLAALFLYLGRRARPAGQTPGG